MALQNLPGMNDWGSSSGESPKAKLGHSSLACFQAWNWTTKTTQAIAFMSSITMFHHDFTTWYNCLMLKLYFNSWRSDAVSWEPRGSGAFVHRVTNNLGIHEDQCYQNIKKRNSKKTQTQVFPNPRLQRSAKAAKGCNSIKVKAHHQVGGFASLWVDDVSSQLFQTWQHLELLNVHGWSHCY